MESLGAAVITLVAGDTVLEFTFGNRFSLVLLTPLVSGDFLAANDNVKHPRSKPILSSPTWFPPSGTVAISVDSAFVKSHGAGIGVVARDSAGRVLGGFAQHSAAPGSSASVEVVAVLASLHLACEQGWPMVVIQTDSTDSVQIANRLRSDPESNLSELLSFLDPHRRILSAHSCFHVQFISLSINTVAHTLATWALNCTHSLFFDSVCPEIIRSIINNELVT
ncbi:hypothetical protein GQ457_16G016050 [Hibiscus cannabinus]